MSAARTSTTADARPAQPRRLAGRQALGLPRRGDGPVALGRMGRTRAVAVSAARTPTTADSRPAQPRRL
ncbi:hypothetical protein, partial [Streptomyces sp. Root369]|uniref:hypothetical protein n=1 Tax=Streptomyces sp. Root369 TaxID=1736523 RepID=UPI001A9020D2